MKYEVRGALIQHPCQDLPDNFQPTGITAMPCDTG